jgi:VWFA-related protein
MVKRHLVLILVMAAAFVRPSVAQNPQPARVDDPDSLSISAEEVQIDAVVRDKRGRLVKDLQASDFQVLEDGVPQRITSCRLISGTATSVEGSVGSNGGNARPAAGASSSPPGLAGPKEPRVVALVFDRLAPDARALAWKAAVKYLESEVRPEDFVGVFMTDTTFRIFVPLTRDKAAVRAAVDRAAGTSTSATKPDSVAVQNAVREASPGAPDDAPSFDVENKGQSTVLNTSSATTRDDSELRYLRFKAMTLDAFNRLEQTRQGDETTNALLALVQGLGQLPGRKAAVFFSTGIQIPDTVLPRYEAIIGTANRAGVSFYTVDAAGLRMEGVSFGVKHADVPQQSALGIQQPLLRNVEAVETNVRSGPEWSLGRLAKQTGGAYVSDTNDPSKGLRQVREDLDTHYVLSYAPTNPNFDGSFRKVSLKTTRSDLDVRSREGYFAIENVGSLGLLAYEARPVARLASGKDERAFPLRAAMYYFRKPGADSFVSIVAEAPASAFTFTPSTTPNTPATDFSIVALVRNEQGDVVLKESQRYQMSVAPADLGNARMQNVLFYREERLAPGHYTVEMIAFDAPSGKASTRRKPLDVRPGTGLDASSVVLVGHADKLGKDDAQMSNPLRFGDLLLYPNLGEPVSKATSKEFVFFMTIYPAGRSAKLDASMDVVRAGKSLGHIPLTLPAPDADGAVRLASGIPTANLEPGLYELKATVSDGANVITRSTSVQIAQ